MICVVMAEFEAKVVIGGVSLTACISLGKLLADSRVATLPPDRRAFPGEFGRPDFALDAVRLRPPILISGQNDDELWLDPTIPEPEPPYF